MKINDYNNLIGKFHIKKIFKDYLKKKDNIKNMIFNLLEYNNL